MAELLEMKGIIKRFGPVTALNGVDISIDRGEVLSLCGENGSGKSTLMKVLCGIYPHGTYEGEIYFGGELIEAKSIKDTERRGIAVIHQELALIKELSILENIFLGNEIESRGVMNFSAMHKRSIELLKLVKLEVSPLTKVGDLGVGQQQLVEIAKALSKQARLLVLDEPSAPLTESETDVLLDLVKDLRNRGVSCIYISHKLGEVKEISDKISVIRDGEHVGTRRAKDMSTDDIISMMVGRELTELFPREEHEIGEVILEVNNVDALEVGNPNRKRVDNASFTLRKGEILGVSGLVGSGRTELMECIYGCYQGQHTASIRLGGELHEIKNCHDALALGIAMVPEDRKKNGIVPILGVDENISLASLEKVSTKGVLNAAVEARETLDAIEKLKVKTSSPNLPINNLSGGNQQKAILARFLMKEPNVLILDEPTRGIDVGAKYEIYKLMFELVHKGVSIIMVSSELPEVLGISDRVLVMHEGIIKGNLENNNLTQEQVMDCALSEGITQ